MMMTAQPQWETIEAPAGMFIGWGDRPGQKVVGKVVDYDDTGGQDYNDNPCPQLVVELIESCTTYTRKHGSSTLNVGDLVTITAGQANLKRNLRAAALTVGDLVSIEFTEIVNTSNGTMKSFRVQVARAKHDGTSPAAAPNPPSVGGNPFAAKGNPFA